MDAHAPPVIDSHAAVIGLWPKPEVKNFADAVGVDQKLAAVWKHRKSIPPEWWPQTAAAAAELGRGDVSVSLLAATRPARKSGEAAA